MQGKLFLRCTHLLYSVYCLWAGKATQDRRHNEDISDFLTVVFMQHRQGNNQIVALFQIKV